MIDWKEFTVLIPYDYGDGKVFECPICGLCGNSGIVDTTKSATAANGKEAGIRTYCICPNGRARKKKGDALQDFRKAKRE